MASTLHHVQQQFFTGKYMNDCNACTGDSLDDFASGLLSVKKVARLTDPKDICFAKVEGNLLKFL